ncbi:TPA: VENN motif pre-toxin domain-containing protein [Proteus mirabilis]
MANASSPYLATLIKQQVGEDNKAANAMAHAVLGAVVAELNNQSAAAGGLGAGGGELSAHVILNTLFPGKKVSDLTESEKQQVSALSQLAAGLAGGLTTGDMAGAITGSQAGKNAVENNLMSAKPIIKGLEKGYESCMKNATCRNGLMQLGVNFGLTAAQIQEAMDAGIAARNGDIEVMRQLTPEQIAYIDERIINNQGPARLMFGEQTWGDRIWAESDGSADNKNSTPNIGKGLTNEQKNELGGSSSGAPGGWEPQDEENARNRELQQKRFDELSKIYDKNSPSQDITIDGQTIRQGIGGNRYSTRVYESQNLTDQQIYNYAEQLAAQPLTKVKDGIYTAKLADGTMITLRSVSSSAEQTGARWTIQIRNSPTLKQAENGLGKNAEIKFR